MDDLAREVLLLTHRVTKLEEERLPTRVAQLETSVEHVERAVKEINDNLLTGLDQIKLEVMRQRATMRGVALAFGGLITLLGAMLTLKELLA